MSLATISDLVASLTPIAGHYGYISRAGSQSPTRCAFDYSADGTDFFYYDNGTVYHTPFSFSTSFSTTSEISNRYYNNTGKKWDDNIVDFMYHWTTKFRSLQTKEQIQERMQDPASAGAFATTYAVNSYLALHSSLSEEEVKSLFTGSHWRWKKLDTGDYIQQTLYPRNSGGESFILVNNRNAFSHLYRITSLRDFIPWLEEQNEDRTTEEDEEEEGGTLMEHSDRATSTLPFIQGKEAHRTFLGVELELEGYSMAEFKSLNVIKDHAIFKRDGSLDNGVEICSAPATLGVHKEKFKKLFDAMQTNNSELSAEITCGMHVHIDRKKLSSLHVANLCLFLNNPENESPIVHLAGRNSNNYCERVNHKYQDFTFGNAAGTRYRRVNLTNSATVELRLFASTTNYEDFCTRLEFTQAAVDYTRPGETTIPCKGIPIWGNFKDYVLSHKKFYPNLVTALK